MALGRTLAASLHFSCRQIARPEAKWPAPDDERRHKALDAYQDFKMTLVFEKAGPMVVDSPWWEEADHRGARTQH